VALPREKDEDKEKSGGEEEEEETINCRIFITTKSISISCLHLYICVRKEKS
jgi:hypothetical protein